MERDIRRDIMAFNTEFMAYIYKNKGLAEGFRYQVSIPLTGSKDGYMLRFMCQEASIPGKEIETMEKVYGYGSVYALPKMEKYEDVNLKFRCTNGASNGWGYPEWTFFYDWMEEIVDTNTNTFSYKSQYARDTFIETFNKQGKRIHLTKLPSAYPTKIGDMSLTTEQKEMEFEVTLTCDFVLHNDDAGTIEQDEYIKGTSFLDQINNARTAAAVN